MAWGPISIGGSVSGYTLPAATGSVLGGVKTGKNITNTNGTISLSKENVTAALGFTPANSAHTHSYAGSASAGGSATSAAKLDTSTAGTATKPVYFSGGKPVACTYELKKTVPADAIFTDHTYSAMKGATASAAGTAGLVPAPAKGAQGKVLSGAGTYIDVYTKAQGDALQEKVDSAAAAATKPVVVWSDNLSAGSKATKTYTVPTSVDYIVVWTSAGAVDTAVARYLLPGSSLTLVSSSTAKFNTDHTLTIYNDGNSGVCYYVGYHYETYSDGVKIPQLVSTKSVTSANSAQSVTVDDDVDYVILRWNTTSDTDKVAIPHSMMLLRGGQQSDSWYTFTDAGKVTVPTTRYFFSGTYYITCYHYATPEELAAQQTAIQSAQADTDAMTVDQEYRIALLELGITDETT